MCLRKTFFGQKYFSFRKKTIIPLPSWFWCVCHGSEQNPAGDASKIDGASGDVRQQDQKKGKEAQKQEQKNSVCTRYEYQRQSSNGGGDRVHRSAVAAIPPQQAAAQQAAAQLAAASASATKTSSINTSTGKSNSFCFCLFQFWDQLRISSRRVMLLLLLLLSSAYVATTQARSAPSTPSARHLNPGSPTRRCRCCCCYHGALELK